MATVTDLNVKFTVGRCFFPQELKAYDDPPIVCGRVFRSGEPTYTCRSCRMDRTCVLCIQCFQHSEHRNHRYKISSSEGGGFCDCGDPEAWKSHPSCSIHSVAEVKQRDGSEIIAKMPEDLVKRITFMIQSCLDYCVEILCKENSRPAYLEISEAERLWETPVNLFALSDRYVTLLYNDETHSYNVVMYTLTRSVDVSSKVAIDYATMVDQEGRCVISVGTFKECSSVKTRVEQLSSREPLKTTVCHAFQLGHELVCHTMLQWLHKIVGLSNGIKKIFADAIMNRCVSNGGLRLELWI